MKQDKFIALLSRKLSGEIAAKDQDRLDRALETNNAYRELATQLEQYFKQSSVTTIPAPQISDMWDRIAGAEQQPGEGKFNDVQSQRSLSHAIWLKVAAALVLIAGAGLWAYQLLHRHQEEVQSLATANERIFKVLDDGTSIWLNKRSVLTYNEAFGRKKREIFLKGEAYFDVAKNGTVPLVIHAGAIDIEVKGTAFNVNAYQEDENIQVALIRGAIAVTNRQDASHRVLLKPNDKLIFSNKPAVEGQPYFHLVTLNPHTLLNETGWAADTLVFTKEKLQNLAVKLEKKYDIKIEIHSPRLKEMRFSGTFITETIQQALEALKISYPLTYTIHDRLVIIKE